MVVKIKREKKNNKWWIAFSVLFAMFFTVSFGVSVNDFDQFFKKDDGDEPEKMAYNDFVTRLECGDVKFAEYASDKPTFEFYLKDTEKAYITDNPEKEDFKELLLIQGVKIGDGTDKSNEKSLPEKVKFIITVLSCAVGAAVESALFLLIFSMAGFSDLIEKKKKEKAKTVSFKDIIGLDEIKSDLLFIVSLMKSKSRDNAVRVPKGILLEGPPGNGKTMLAQAIATEAKVNFLAVNASDLISKFFGETGKSVRKLFEKARQNSPCVIFIDEIDALGAKRNGESGDSIAREYNGIINTLLTQMDGITDSAGITVIAATNMASTLDPALVRPGRFDKHFLIPNPDSDARKKLLAGYLNDELQTKLNYDKFAGMTRGLSCSEIENVANEAKLSSIKEGKSEPDEDDVLKAVKQYLLKGFQKEKYVISEKERHTTAVHEAGHAIVGHYFSKRKIMDISICPTTSGVGGYTQSEQITGDNLAYADDVFGIIAMLFGGKAAEYAEAGSADTVSLGSENDIVEATRIAKEYVRHKAGIDYVQFGTSGEQELMKEAKTILDDAYRRAVETVRNYADKIKAVAAELEKNESMSGDGFYEIIGRENER